MRMLLKVLGPLVLVATLPVLTQCRTPASVSNTAGADEIRVGMETHEGDAIKRKSWAARMGFEFQNDAGAAVVKKIEEAQFGRVIGLAEGDVIVAVNGKAVNSAQAFQEAAKAFAGNGAEAARWNGVWTLKVTRGGRALTLKPVAGHDCDPYLLIGCGPLFGPRTN